MPSLPGTVRLVWLPWRMFLGRIRALRGASKLTSPQLGGLGRKCITKWPRRVGTQARTSSELAWVTPGDNGASVSYHDVVSGIVYPYDEHQGARLQ